MAAAVFVCACTLAGATAPLKADWVEVTSPSFVVVGNGSAKRAQRVAGEFEAFRQAVSTWFPGIEHDPSPIAIFALTTNEAMQEFANSPMPRIAGFFRHGELGGEILLTLEVETQQSFGVLYHEYVHSVTRHSLPGLPLWLSEGLAEVLGTSIIGEKQMQVGIVHDGHRRYLGESKLMSLDDLVDPDLAAEAYTDLSRRPQFYAQAWALTHYFMMADGGTHWSQLIQYLEALARGREEKVVWNEIFGSRAKVTRALWKYLSGRRFSSRIVEVAVGVDGASFPTRSLSEAEANAYRGDFLSRGGDRALAGRLLGEATGDGEGPALAYEALGHLALEAGLLEPARRHLERALEIEENRHRALYHLAEVERRERSEDWHLRAERHLLDAIYFAPWFGAAKYRLAVHYAAVDSTPQRALIMARQALEQTRGNPLSHLLLAKLLREKGEGATEATESIRFAVHLANTSSSAMLANNVCWYGTLFGLADGVLRACDMAVRRAPESAAVIDSRALARAVLGDLGGALEDFKVFLEDESVDETIREQREGWVEELEQGRNPIDEETLASLLASESG